LPLKQKRNIQFNYARLLGYTGTEAKQTARAIFRNFALSLHDFFLPQNIQFDTYEREKIENLRKTHPGFMLITFHMGGWELGPRKLLEWNWPLTAVYQPYQNKKFRDLIEKNRAPGVEYLPVGKGAAQGVQAALRKGKVVAMLGDHLFGENGTPVQLFGHKVKWPKGPVVLAVKQKAPIVVVTVIRKKPGFYDIRFEDPLIPQSTSRAEVLRLTQEVANKFGILLQRHPDQWLRMEKLEFL